MNKEKIKLSLFLEFIILVGILGVTSIFITNDNIQEETSFLVDIGLETEIDIKVKQLRSKYGINIIYGDETIDIVRNVNGNVILDENIILKNLNILENTLLKYRDDFFLKDRLTIVLLKSFNNNNLALASKNNLGEYKIYLSDNKDFERSIHHEIYHVFEYMNDIKDDKEYIKWNKLNPKDFSYSNNINLLNNKYIFGSTLESNDVYFVSKYSKTSSKEDRAEVFAEMMIDRYDFNDNINLINKIDMIEEIINDTNSKILIDINKYD